MLMVPQILSSVAPSGNSTCAACCVSALPIRLSGLVEVNLSSRMPDGFLVLALILKVPFHGWVCLVKEQVYLSGGTAALIAAPEGVTPTSGVFTLATGSSSPLL